MYPPPQVDLSVCLPPPFADAVTYERKLLYFHNVDLSENIYLQYCIAFNGFV
jgi:hypothetical protein